MPRPWPIHLESIRVKQFVSESDVSSGLLKSNAATESTGPVLQGGWSNIRNNSAMHRAMIIIAWVSCNLSFTLRLSFSFFRIIINRA